MIGSERETTVTVTDDSTEVIIWTAQRKYITQLQKHPSFKLLRAGTYEGSPWAEFSIPADQWSPVRGAKRSRNLTEEQRAALAERMSLVRASSRTK